VLLALTSVVPSHDRARPTSDMVTPYGVTRYVLDHLPPTEGEERSQLKLYRRRATCSISMRTAARPSPRTPGTMYAVPMTDAAHHTADDGLDQYIPVRKGDILSALVEQGAVVSEDERDKFRQLCENAGLHLSTTSIFALLERLRKRLLLFQSRETRRMRSSTARSSSAPMPASCKPSTRC